MKNLLNCHSVGLHSFPIGKDEKGFYQRIFYADFNHNLWKPFELAIHPHHTDIKITVLEGTLYNSVFEVVDNGTTFKKYHWNSHILEGKGGFEFLGLEDLQRVSQHSYSLGESVTLFACQLHTVFVEKGQKCVWLIEESAPSCEYFPFNYSTKDLSNWTPEGLYIECDDEVKQNCIGKYLTKTR